MTKYRVLLERGAENDLARLAFGIHERNSICLDAMLALKDGGLQSLVSRHNIDLCHANP